MSGCPHLAVGGATGGKAPRLDDELEEVRRGVAQRGLARHLRWAVGMRVISKGLVGCCCTARHHRGGWSCVLLCLAGFGWGWSGVVGGSWSEWGVVGVRLGSVVGVVLFFVKRGFARYVYRQS